MRIISKNKPLDKLLFLAYNANMEKPIYDDFVASKEFYMQLHAGKLNDDEYISKLLATGHIIDYFALFFDELFDVFKNQHYAPRTMDDANNFLMKNYYKIDETQEIAAVYTKKVDGKEKTFITNISKNDYYKAYYKPIWINLSLKERAQILKWHFDTKKEMYGQKALKLRLIEDSQLISRGKIDGFCGKNIMFINNFLLYNFNPFDIVTTIEHEFQHINQLNSYKYFNKEKKEKHNLYEKIILGKKDALYCPTNFMLTDTEYDNLYWGYIMERKAQQRALKEYEKINRANQQLFGVCEEQNRENKEDIWKLKMDSGLLSVEEVEKSGKYSKEEVENYRKNKNILDNSDYFSMLSLLMKDSCSKYYALRREENEIIKSGRKNEEQEKLKQIISEQEKYKEIIGIVNDNYKDVLRNNGKKLPKKMFEELNLEN